MVRPVDFRPNSETAADNDFQKAQHTPFAAAQALREFQALVDALETAGIPVTVFDPPGPGLPDAVFPNNWLSTHPDGRVILYPMRAPVRRKERNLIITDFLRQHYRVEEVIHLSGFENAELFLEGTGSLVFDHAARRVFAAVSPRTSPALVKLVARILGYDYSVFHTRHPHTGKPIYHTNVMLSIAPDLMIWIPDVVADEGEKATLRELLGSTKRMMVDLPLEALDSFAANVLVLRGQDGPMLVASSSARDYLAPHLPDTVQGLYVSVPTLEHIGGGSVRCMLCENFLEPLVV